MKKKLWTTAIIGNIPVFLICFLLIIPLLVLNNHLYDYDMAHSMNGDDPHSVVVVGIDDQSLSDIGSFPWDRSVYIPVIEKLEAGGVAAIAFDVMFAEKSHNPASDAAFAAVLAKYHNIILPVQADFTGKASDLVNDSDVLRSPNEPIKSKGVLMPYKLFADADPILAHVNADIDPDGVIRKTFLEINTPQGMFKSLAVRAAELFGVDTAPVLAKYPNGEMQIKYNYLSSDTQLLSFSTIMNETDPPKLKNTIALVGFTANGIADDDGPTPVEKKTKLVYVHANIIHQLIDNQFLKGENKTVTYALILCMFLIAVFLSWKFKPTISFISVFVIIILLLYGQYITFANHGFYVNVVNPIAALLLSFLVNISLKTYFETKQKNYITKQFGRYISPDLVKEIAKSDQEIILGGISKELSVLFLDVRGFTPLSEKLKPEEIVGFLNMMFNLITEKALENKGTIDKFIGDAAMILFNAPLDVLHHEYYAVKTAYEIQKGMVQVRADVLEKYGITISVGIGINTGEVVVGNIGSYLRIDYTAIGDNVNTAARIESNAQPNQVLVSEANYERTKQYFEFNYVGEKMMKGKTVGIKVYEVVSELKQPE